MTISDVIIIVAESMEIKPELITSRDRTEAVANARAVVQAVLRNKGWTLKRIADVFGQSHTAAMHNVLKVEAAQLMAKAYNEAQNRILAEKATTLSQSSD
jgi:chromosomal replication initiation ATPase DnaA